MNFIFTHLKKTSGTSLLNALDLSSFNIMRTRKTWKLKFKTLGKQPFILYGHKPYGVHKKIFLKAEYFTVLAPPLERNISDYYFSKQSKSINYEHPDWRYTQLYDIVEFMERGHIKDNYLVRQISGVRRKKLDKSDLELAKYNLKHKYAAFGLKSQFENNCKLISNLLEVSYEIPEKRYKKTFKEDLPPKTLERLRKFQELDEEFYKFAEELYQNQNLF